MRVKTSLGFAVKVDDEGKFMLPDRAYTSSDLKKISRDVNRAQRKLLADEQLEKGCAGDDGD